MTESGYISPTASVDSWKPVTRISRASTRSDGEADDDYPPFGQFDTILEHLEDAYPPHGLVDGYLESSRFLEQERSHDGWPPEAKRFTWRYMHENRLYDVKKQSKVEVARFATALERYLGLECTSKKHESIVRRCESFISKHVSDMKKAGILFETSRGRCQTKAFTNLWRSIRQKWHENHDLTHQDPKELSSPREVLAVFASKESQYLSSQRRNDPPLSVARPIEIPTIDLDGPTIEVNSLPNPQSRLRLNAPPAQVAQAGNSSSKSYEDSHAEVFSKIKEITTIVSSAGNSSSDTSRSHGHNQATTSSTGTHTQGTNNALRLSSYNRSNRPSANQGDGSRDPSQRPPALAPARPTVRPPKIRLQFLLQGPSNVLDLDDPLSRKQLFGKSIPELFECFCQRTNLTPGSVDRLTFRCLDWAEGQAFLLCRSDAEQIWKDLQRRLNVEFEIAKGEFDDDEVFLVAVKRGDVRKRKRAAETYEE